MKTYKVTYSGNATRFQNFENIINADSARDAVEDTYALYCDQNYFPQEDGSVLDCDGNEVASATDEAFFYDGGYFSAEEIEDEDF